MSEMLVQTAPLKTPRILTIEFLGALKNHRFLTMLTLAFLTTIGNLSDRIPEALGRRISEHEKINDFLCSKSCSICLHPNLKNADTCILDGIQKLKVFDESTQTTPLRCGKTQGLFDCFAFDTKSEED